MTDEEFCDKCIEFLDECVARSENWLDVRVRMFVYEEIEVHSEIVSYEENNYSWFHIHFEGDVVSPPPWHKYLRFSFKIFRGRDPWSFCGPVGLLATKALKTAMKKRLLEIKEEKASLVKPKKLRILP